MCGIVRAFDLKQDAESFVEVKEVKEEKATEAKDESSK